jgi:hypothetical protein
MRDAVSQFGDDVGLLPGRQPGNEQKTDCDNNRQRIERKATTLRLRRH